MHDLMVVGGGLAGSEAAWQAAERGINVLLYEMRPLKKTPAHHTGLLAELVCSNSLRAQSLTNAVGLLKEELYRLGSLVIACARETGVPAGGALAVDREVFASLITRKIEEHPRITIKREEITSIPDHRPLIIATGPLTSESLAKKLLELTGEEYLYFYDAAAPIVTAESINRDRVFAGSRYGKGTDDYINCPMTEKEYDHFWSELVSGEKHISHLPEEEKFFEGCMPVEEMASRGRDTLLFGPLKPVGLIDPSTDRKPYAVVQLRQDNLSATLYNMVGFQTTLKWPEQKRIFRLIPGLEGAEFVRFGMMHRNTFLNAPVMLNKNYELKKADGVYIAGQLSGVEGYVESTASGLVCGINAAARIKGKAGVDFPPDTAVGALGRYITEADPGHFQPMNVNFAMITPLKEKVPKKKRRELMAERSLAILEAIRKNLSDFA